MRQSTGTHGCWVRQRGRLYGADMVDFIDGTVDPEAQARGDQLFGQIFFTPDGYADPIPFYQSFLDEVPVHVSGFGGAILSRYDDSRTLLRDPRFGNGDAGPGSAFGSDTSEAGNYRREMFERRKEARPQSMLGLDPPDHTRQRSLVSRAFTPRTVEKLRPRIRELVEGCLDDLAEAETGDAMELLALPLPVSVISEMLGVPHSDWPTIRDQVTDVVASLEPSASLEELKKADAASTVLWHYFTDLVEVRRKDPEDDLLSALIAAADGEDKLTNDEILATAQLLFAAGAETTTNLIGNGLHQLLKHPDQLDKLFANHELVPSLVEEILRYDSPVQLDGRACLEPAEVAGLRFEEGDRVLTLLGAANHDPAKYERPDDFDIARYHGPNPAEPVMSFGSGIHYCLGANLAKVEGQEVFAGLLRRFSKIDDAGDRVYRNRLVLRGLEVCPITVS